MALPPVGYIRKTIELSGGPCEVRGLSYSEGQKVKGEQAVAWSIACGTDTPVAEVKAWLNQAPAGDVQKLMEAITELSGFGEDAQFPDGPGDVPEPARETN